LSDQKLMALQVKITIKSISRYIEKRYLSALFKSKKDECNKYKTKWLIKIGL
jgi:hypothetical protein